MKTHVLKRCSGAGSQFVWRWLIAGSFRAGWRLQAIGMVRTALWLLRSVNEQCGDTLASLLDRMLPKARSGVIRFLWTLPLGTRGDSEKAFELRLRLARMGHADGLLIGRV